MKTTRHGDYERKVLFPVWSNYCVHVIFTEDIAGSLKRRGREFNATSTDALHWNRGNGHSVLMFQLGNAPSGTIAHECWHAIRTMLVDYCGVETMEDEVTAYHLGYLVQQVTNFKNDLIDFGVKSNNEVQPNGISNPQGSDGAVRRLQPGETTPGEARTSQEVRGHHSGRSS